MTAILGYVDVLSDGCARKCPLSHSGIGDPLDVIRQNADHLLRIIDDILDLSKIEAGKLLSSRPMLPCRIVAEVASLMRVRATAKGLSLDAEFDGPIPETIESDPTRLRQILLNLVGNAIKFTEAGGVAWCRAFGRSGRAARCCSSTSSTPASACPRQLARLFQPFTQADASTTRRFGGTGLGLTISKRLAEMLGGDIAVTARPERAARSA